MLDFSEDRRSLLFAAAHFALVALAYVYEPTGLLGAITTAVIAFSAFMQLASGHNAMHSRVFKRASLNQIWRSTLSLCFTYPVSAFVPVHNVSHHQHLQSPKDVLRTTEVRHRSNLLNLLHHVAMATAHVHVLNATYFIRSLRQRPQWAHRVVYELVPLAIYTATLCAIDSGALLRFVLLPSAIGQCMIIGFGYVQHDGTDPDSEYQHSHNFTGRLFNWLIFDNGWHTIHHLKPDLHWSRMRAAHQARVAARIHPGLMHRSVLAYMWRAYIAPGARLRFDGHPVVPSAQPRPRDLLVALVD